MGKDPAFLFYPGDWLGGTTTFTRHEKGAYMDLLMAQFGQVSLTIEEVQTVLGVDWPLWERKLKKKFEVEGNEPNLLYFNRKLRDEVIRRKSFVVTRNNNLEGKNQYSRGHMTTKMTSHMENGNENRNKDVIEKVDRVKGKKEKKPVSFVKDNPPTVEEVKAYCLQRKNSINAQYFVDKNTTIGWIDKNKIPYRDWKAVIRTWESWTEKTTVNTNTQPMKRPVLIVVVEKIASGKSNHDILHELVGTYSEHEINEALMQARGNKQ